MSNNQLSVVVPFFNEQEVLPQFVLSLKNVLDMLNLSYEVLFVDDGSTDDSIQVLNTYSWPEARIICLQRNYGHQVALEAGLKEANGDWVLTLDSDLQHPPNLIPDMLRVGREFDVDVAQAVRGARAEDSRFKRLTAKIYYGVIDKISTTNVTRNAADFRLMSSRVVRVVNSIPEEKVFRLLLPQLGFRTINIEYSASPRYAGESKYSLAKMIKLALESVISFSGWPLKVVALMGLVTSILSMVWLLFVAFFFITGRTIEGWASVASMVLFLGGMQLMAVGVFGLYLGRIYEYTKGRPGFLVAAVIPLSGTSRKSSSNSSLGAK